MTLQTARLALTAELNAQQSKFEASRRQALRLRFNLLPDPLGSPAFEIDYQGLRVRAEALLKVVSRKALKTLSKVLTRMEKIRDLAKRNEEIAASPCEPVTLLQGDRPWEIDTRVSPRVFSRRLSWLAGNTAVLAVTSLLSPYVAVQKAVQAGKIFFNGLLREENERRQPQQSQVRRERENGQSKIEARREETRRRQLEEQVKQPLLKHRDELFVAGQSGAFWRQRIVLAAKHALAVHALVLSLERLRKVVSVVAKLRDAGFKTNLQNNGVRYFKHRLAAGEALAIFASLPSPEVEVGLRLAA